MKKNNHQGIIRFYLDTTVAGFKKTELIIEDYFYWFSSFDKTELVLFTSSEHPPQTNKILKTAKHSAPLYKYIKERIKPSELHKFYSKKILLNEWVNYKKNDLFRIYKMFYPVRADINFDNQPISIQYDIRYHEKRDDAYSSYKENHLSGVKNAIQYYKPKTVFDLGCGAGAQFNLLKALLNELKVQYYGVDISRFQTIKAIDLFESKYAHFSLGNALNLNFKDNFADISFSESTLPFLKDPLKGLSELNRISKDGFFASLYTIRKRHDFLLPFKKNNIYALDTGATWKYYEKITPNKYYLPDYKSVMELSENFNNTIVVEENSDQFFEPLGVTTSNLFFFPKKWYLKSNFKNTNYRPLM